MIKVLIVDDSAVVRYALKSIIELRDSEFYLSSDVSSGMEAVEMIKNDQPDVILMDIDMPGMDGIETTKIINNVYPEVKIIGFSLYTDEKIARRMINAGAVTVLRKGATPSELFEAIFSCLEKSPV